MTLLKSLSFLDFKNTVAVSFRFLTELDFSIREGEAKTKRILTLELFNLCNRIAIGEITVRYIVFL